MNDKKIDSKGQAKVIENLKHKLADKKAYYNTYLYYAAIQTVVDDLVPSKKGIFDKPSYNCLKAN